VKDTGRLSSYAATWDCTDRRTAAAYSVKRRDIIVSLWMGEMLSE